MLFCWHTFERNWKNWSQYDFSLFKFSVPATKCDSELSQIQNHWYKWVRIALVGHFRIFVQISHVVWYIKWLIVSNIKTESKVETRRMRNEQYCCSRCWSRTERKFFPGFVDWLPSVDTMESTVTKIGADWIAIGIDFANDSKRFVPTSAF